MLIFNKVSMNPINLELSNATITELKASHDERFIRLAYRVILDREVDTEGLLNFMAHIGENLSTSDIITELYNSPEWQLCRKNFLVPYAVVQQTNNVTKRTLYYYVDHTIQCPINSGVQRVVRRFAKALLDIGENVKFVKWCSQTNQLVLINKNELQHLGQWNGPAITEAILNSYPEPNQSSVQICLNTVNCGDWLIIPEVPHITFQAHPMTLEIISKGKQLGLKLAFIFHDATPLRRVELKDMSDKHTDYMQQLLLVDLIVPNSNYSSSDLVSFFKFYERANPNLGTKIIPILMSGESQLAAKVDDLLSYDFTNTTILSVGSIVPHKNQLMLVRVFHQYCKTNPNTNWKLKLVGNLHPALADEILNTYMDSSHFASILHIWI
jgi:glycosyltransferase involved in cell wall biosynthesis